MFRFVYLRSFHRPIIVRLEVLDDGTGRVTGKVASGQGGYEPGKLKREEVSHISQAQVEQFLAIVNEPGFWDIGPLKTLGLDGASWILQGSENGKLYSRERWSPESGRFRDAASLLLEYSGLQVDPVY